VVVRTDMSRAWLGRGDWCKYDVTQLLYDIRQSYNMLQTLSPRGPAAAPGLRRVLI